MEAAAREKVRQKSSRRHPKDGRPHAARPARYGAGEPRAGDRAAPRGLRKGDGRRAHGRRESAPQDPARRGEEAAEARAAAPRDDARAGEAREDLRPLPRRVLDAGRRSRTRIPPGPGRRVRAADARRAGRLAGDPSAHGAGDGEPDLAAPLRPRNRADPQRVRLPRAAAVQSRADRLAGLRIRGARIQPEGDASAPHEVRRVSAVGRAGLAEGSGKQPVRTDEPSPARRGSDPRQPALRQRSAEPGDGRPSVFPPVPADILGARAAGPSAPIRRIMPAGASTSSRGAISASRSSRSSTRPTAT